MGIMARQTAHMPTTHASHGAFASVMRIFKRGFSGALIISAILAGVMNAQDTQLKTQLPGGDPEKFNPHKLSLVLLEPGALVSANFQDAAQFGGWTKQVLEICEGMLAKEKKPPRLLVQITLRKDAAPVFELSGQPALSAKFSKALQAALASAPDMRAPFSPVSFRLQNMAPGTSPDANPLKLAESFVPRLVPPRQKELENYHKSSIAEKYRLLIRWARDEALPLLAGSCQRVDEQFVGVRNVGKMLSRLSYDSPLDVGKLTFQNPDYWRGALEMVPGNHQVIAASVLLLVANGEIDKAAALFRHVRTFAFPDVLATDLYEMLGRMGDSLIADVEWEIKQGIALHDKGKHDAAIAAYQKLLADYPCSAWARYELFFSQAAKLGLVKPGVSNDPLNNEVRVLWEKSAVEIYRMNPLYNMQFTAARGESVGSLLDRLALSSLAKDRPADHGEYYGRLARAMLNLGEYGYAAHVYSLLMPTKFVLKEPAGRNNPTDDLVELSTGDVITRFLYCLEKLGCAGLKKNFKGDFAPMFQKLDEAIEKHQKQ